jgi:hypothetical protein
MCVLIPWESIRLLCRSYLWLQAPCFTRQKWRTDKWRVIIKDLAETLSVREFHFLSVAYLVCGCCRVRVFTVRSAFRFPILTRHSWICPVTQSLFLSLVTICFPIPLFHYHLLTLFFPMALRPNTAMASSILRFLDHNQRRTTVGRTPLDESQRPVPENIQHSQQTDIHGPGGIQTQNASKRAAADPRLRPRGHWDRPSADCCQIIVNVSRYPFQ